MEPQPANAHSPAAAPTVLWITHLPTPYRVPVWRELVQLGWRLDIAIVERKLGRFGSENRGSDWAPTQINGVRYILLNTFIVRVGRAPLHILLPTRHMRVRGHAVVLLGGWESPAYWWTLLAARLRGIPVVGFYESPLATRRHDRGPVAWIQKRIFSQYCYVVVPGRAAEQSVLALKVPPERILVGFNAVDVQYFHDSANSARASGGRDLRGRFLFVGQLISRKRVDALISEIANSADDTLSVVGTGDAGDELRALTTRLRVSDRVHFLGMVKNDELPATMAEHQTLVLVSREEVWGLVANEALAAGLSVVVAKSCGVTDSISHMPGVFVVKDDLSDLRARLDEATAYGVHVDDNAEILTHTPEEFASTFARAFARASL